METYGETSTNSSPKSISKSMKLHINSIPKVHCNTQTVIKIKDTATSCP